MKIKLESAELPETGVLEIPGFRVTVGPAEEIVNSETIFTAHPTGKLILRCRSAGDEISLPGGTKSVKKLFIDRKIPAHQRLQIPVIADDAGIVGIYGIGTNKTHIAQELPAVQIQIEPVE